jgi:hypothetical protein
VRDGQVYRALDVLVIEQEAGGGHLVVQRDPATAYVSLGLAERVQHYIGLAMPDISASGSPWGRSLVMIDLAVSFIRSGDADLERAYGLVIEALGSSADRPVISVRQRTADFVRDATARWGSAPQVDAVRDAAAAIKGH